MPLIRQSLSSWRAWIEMIRLMPPTVHTSRSPHGERGLKSHDSAPSKRNWPRRSPHGERGLKYERVRTNQYPQTRRSPHGERGLKYVSFPFCVWGYCRSPHGERGLKYNGGEHIWHCRQSLSSWRAWIEIALTEGAERTLRSLSSWRAWIEIDRIIRIVAVILVALLMESVD